MNYKGIDLVAVPTLEFHEGKAQCTGCEFFTNPAFVGWKCECPSSRCLDENIIWIKAEPKPPVYLKFDDQEYAEEYLKYETEWDEGLEYGPMDKSETFDINGELVKVTVKPEWNRHDKRFYYIDGWYTTEFEKVKA